MCNWAESYMTESKGSRFCDRYTNMIYRLNDSFGREQCRFFDPSVKFGGPNPDDSMVGMECDQDDLNDPDMAAFCDEKEARKISTPNRKLKRYSTGLAKWCNRYIKECYGQ